MKTTSALKVFGCCNGGWAGRAVQMVQAACKTLGAQAVAVDGCLDTPGRARLSTPILLVGPALQHRTSTRKKLQPGKAERSQEMASSSLYGAAGWLPLPVQRGTETRRSGHCTAVLHASGLCFN